MRTLRPTVWRPRVFASALLAGAVVGYSATLVHAQAASSSSLAIDDAYAQGTYLFRQEDYSGAVLAFSRVLVLDKRHVTALLGRGNARLALFDYARALDDYNRAVDVNDRYPEAYLARGTLRWLKGQLGQAESDFRKAVSFAPDDEFYYDRLVTVLFERRKVGEVLRVYEKAYRDDPRRNWAVWGTLGVLAGRREWEPLRLAINSFQQKGENGAATSYYAGVYYAAFNDHKKVVDRLESGLQHDPDRMPIQTYMMLATAHNALSNTDAFKKHLHQYYDRTGLDVPGLAMSGLPPEAARHLRDLAIDARNIRVAAFSPTGSWVISHGVRSYRAFAPPKLNAILRTISEANGSLDSVAFTSEGGWIVVGRGEYWISESGIPALLRATLLRITGEGRRINWVSVAPRGGWLISAAGMVYYDDLAPRVEEAMRSTARGLGALGLGPDDQFLLKSGNVTQWYAPPGLATQLQTLSDTGKNWNLAQFVGDTGWLVYSLELARAQRTQLDRHRH